MKKKQYIAPEVEIIELDMIDMLAASIGFVEEEGKDASTSFSNRRRGQWGNLWADEE